VALLDDAASSATPPFPNTLVFPEGRAPGLRAGLRSPKQVDRDGSPPPSARRGADRRGPASRAIRPTSTPGYSNPTWIFRLRTDLSSADRHGPQSAASAQGPAADHRRQPLVRPLTRRPKPARRWSTALAARDGDLSHGSRARPAEGDQSRRSSASPASRPVGASGTAQRQGPRSRSTRRGWPASRPSAKRGAAGPFQAAQVNVPRRTSTPAPAETSRPRWVGTASRPTT